MNKYLKYLIQSFLIAIIGVIVIDLPSHFFFSSPMETLGYFLMKMSYYFAFSYIFLIFIDLKPKKELIKVLVAGVIISTFWGIYYNIIPMIFGFTPFGIPLSSISFLGTSIFLTGLAFGLIHIFAFVIAYYLSKLILIKIK